VYKKAMMLAAIFLLATSARVFVNRTLADETPSNRTPADENSADETLAVEQATNQFYTSLNALLAGDRQGMDDVWSHADNVTYMGPDGGIAVGWDQVREGWNVQAEMKLGGHVEPMDLHVTVGGDIAIVEGYELGSIQDSDGPPRSFRIRATSSFRKESGQWKMIGHHTDLLDSLDSGSDKASNERPSAGWNQQTDADAEADSINVSDDEITLKLER